MWTLEIHLAIYQIWSFHGGIGFAQAFEKRKHSCQAVPGGYYCLAQWLGSVSHNLVVVGSIPPGVEFWERLFSCLSISLSDPKIAGSSPAGGVGTAQDDSEGIRTHAGRA